MRLLQLYVTAFGLMLLAVQANTAQGSTWTRVDIGIIGTASTDILQSAMQQVEDKNHDGLVIRLDTPGGALNATRDMVKKMMGASYPVVVWVGPDGSRAGSAGAFITLAAHVAAMAPGTNIGAAHPIQASGKDVDNEHSARKIEEDTTAFIESIASRRNRNVEMARSFVIASASVTAEEALQHNVIDLIANDLTDLMSSIDGREITLSDGRVVKLATTNAQLVAYDYSIKQEFLSILSNPQIFYLLFIAGLIGLGFELTHPGSIFPGVVGGICLILAFIATAVLPVSFGAMLLVLAGVGFLVVEAFVPSFGILGIGGFIAFMIGSFLLVDPGNEQGLRLPLMTILPVGLLVGVSGIALGYLIFKSESSKIASGSESMIGQKARVLNDFESGRGRVKIAGENWEAKAEEADFNPREGDEVIITAFDGLTLIVQNNKQLEGEI